MDGPVTDGVAVDWVTTTRETLGTTSTVGKKVEAKRAIGKKVVGQRS